MIGTARKRRHQVYSRTPSSPVPQPLPLFILHWPMVFQGLLGAGEPRKMRTVVQKIGRLMLRMLCHALAGGFRAHAFLKSTCPDFVEGGLE